MKKFAVFLFALIATGAKAQAIINADFVRTTPVVTRDEHGIASCGLGILLMAAQGESKALVYDFSVALWNTTQGMIKAGSASINYSKTKGWDVNKRIIRKPGPNLIWIAKRDDSVSLRPSKYINAETDGFVLSAAPGADTMELIVMASRGEPMQVSFQYPNERLHTVMGFRTTMSKDDQQAVLDCMGGLLKRLESDSTDNN